MRSNEEFKAELYRRYDDRLRVRAKRNRLLTACVSLVLCLCIGLGFVLQPAPVRADDLMTGITPNPVTGKAPDEAFIGAQMEFSLDLLKQCYEGENILISPLSVSLALSMTANGARGETLAQMEQVLCGGMDIGVWNQYLRCYVNSLQVSDPVKVSLANSIWLNSAYSLNVKPAFLQTVADYYDASVFKGPFDGSTVQDMNRWIEDATDGMIPEAVDELEGILYLVNALAFDGKWAEAYEANDVLDETFTCADGEKQTVDMMHSMENLYLDDGSATGFMRPYKGGGYYFAALMPNYGTTLTEYLEDLTWEDLLQTLRDAQSRQVQAGLPKFQHDCSVSLNDALQALGMEEAFSLQADLSAMAELPGENLRIGSVDHMTSITVDESGTKASAVTIVPSVPTSAPAPAVSVILDRPFLYMIVDSQTNLPIFIGTVTEVE